MTTVANTAKNIGARDGSVQSIVWGPLTTTNLDGAWVDCADFADKTFQADGTFGAAGSIAIQGSNDEAMPTTNLWPVTKAGTSTAMAFTVLGGGTANENPRWVRPILSGGDGTTAVNVKLVARRATPLRT